MKTVASFPFLLPVMVLLSAEVVFAQKKYEKEYRIDLEKVPKVAVSFIESFPYEKVKWYLEEGLENKSIEAKTKFNHHRHSIEFSVDGVLEDLEITIKKREIPPPTFLAIDTFLSAQFEKHSYRKIQIQFSGSKQTVRQKVLNDTEGPDLITKFELIIKGRNKEGVTLYEFLFSETGTFEKKSEIVFKNTDHLEF